MRRKTRPTTLELGTISSGTLRVEDVLPAMLRALKPLRLSRVERATVHTAHARWNASPSDLNAVYPPTAVTLAGSTLSETWAEMLGEWLTELYDIASAHCPDYCSVGSTEGDGAEIGVWPDMDSLIGDSADPGYTGGPEGDGYVADSRETAGVGHTHAYEVNDHGNATLYRRAGRQWVECWSVV